MGKKLAPQNKPKQPIGAPPIWVAQRQASGPQKIHPHSLDVTQLPMPNGRLKMTPAVKASIVVFLQQCYCITKATRAHGVSVEAFHQHRKRDPAFAASIEAAKRAYIAHLRDQVYMRGVEGWEEPVYYQGAQCGTVRKFSDTLLLRHLTRFDKRYRDSIKQETKHSGKIDGPGAGSNNPLALAMDELSADALAKIDAIFAEELKKKQEAANVPGGSGSSPSRA